MKNQTEKPTNSLKRVLAVLEIFTENRLEWTPEEMMEELGYSRPTLYRYLKTLKEAGLLTSMPNRGFTLGPKVVEMDYLLRKSDPLILHGTNHLKNLTNLYRCTALLVRWYGRKLLCIDSASSTKNPLSSYPRGRPMPLGRGAIGRSIIAFLPRRRLIPIIEENFDNLNAVGLGTNVAEIQESLKSVRQIGYAVAYGEVTPGVLGIAAPIFDAGRNPISSLCVTIAGHLVHGQRIDEIGTLVRQATSEIGKALSSSAQQRDLG